VQPLGSIAELMILPHVDRNSIRAAMDSDIKIASASSKKNKKKNKKKGVTSSNDPPSEAQLDDDEAFLAAMMEEVRLQEAAVAKEQQKIAKLQSASDLIRFKSRNDPELSVEEARLRRFGNGVNLSAIGPIRRKKEGGMFSSEEEKATVLHSSPFTFGFS
jgi:hypothetical protein